MNLEQPQPNQIQKFIESELIKIDEHRSTLKRFFIVGSDPQKALNEIKFFKKIQKNEIEQQNNDDHHSEKEKKFQKFIFEGFILIILENKKNMTQNFMQTASPDYEIKVLKSNVPVSDLNFVQKYLCGSLKAKRIYEYEGQEQIEWQEENYASGYQKKKKKYDEKQALMQNANQAQLQEIQNKLLQMDENSKRQDQKFELKIEETIQQFQKRSAEKQLKIQTLQSKTDQLQNISNQLQNENNQLQHQNTQLENRFNEFREQSIQNSHEKKRKIAALEIMVGELGEEVRKKSAQKNEEMKKKSVEKKEEIDQMQKQHEKMVKVKEEEVKEMEYRLVESYENIQKAKLHVMNLGFNFQNQSLHQGRKQIVEEEDHAMKEFMRIKNIKKPSTAKFGVGKENSQQNQLSDKKSTNKNNKTQ